MTNACTCNNTGKITNRIYYKQARVVQETKRSLPKIAAVMECTCRFTAVSSSTTGLRAASAFSALFIKSAFSVAQSVRSFLKPSFSYSVMLKALVISSLALSVSACWVFKVSCRSVIQSSLILTSACIKTVLGFQQTVQEFEVPTT